MSCRLPGAALGRPADAGCVEEPLGPLAAALREFRAAVADPAQGDGEDLAEGAAVCGGFLRAAWVSSRAGVRFSLSAALVAAGQGATLVQAVRDP